MSWQDDLRHVTIGGRLLIGASFRGVPFFVLSSDRAGGRRLVTHEFPLRDDPYIEDLGRRGRTFAVEGHVIGDDYVTQRDALMAALEDTSGPGQLIHPYHGKRIALCASVTVKETVADGRMAILSIEFIEAPAQTLVPTAVADTSGQVSVSASAALASTQAEFTAGYKSAGMPSFSLLSAQNALSGLSSKLGALLAPIVQDTQELAHLNVEIKSIVSQAANLVRAPDVVLSTFANVLESIANTVADAPDKVMQAFVDTYGADLGALPPATTTTRQQEQANWLALTAALRRILAIEAAQLAPTATFGTLEDATAARDAITAMLDEQAEAAGDDAYPALVQLRADLVRAVPGDSVLARMITIERRTSVPSILLSYQLYGSTSQELDLVARNRVRYPGLMAGELQVLSDV